MSVYLSLADFKGRVNPKLIEDVEDTELQTAIDDAESTFNSYIQTKYTLPLSNVTNDTKRHICNLAVWYVVGYRGFNPDSPNDQLFKSLYEQSILWIKEASRENGVYLDTAQQANGDKLSYSPRIKSGYSFEPISNVNGIFISRG